MFSRRIFLGLCPGLALSQDKPGRQKATNHYNSLYKNGAPYLNLKPNTFLARMVEGRAPGRALDIGMGQGRNAVYLAEKGWDVTGTELAVEGVRLAREAAQRRGVKLNAVLADALKFDYGTEQWDLIVATYVHGVVTRIAARLRESLKPGGMIVVEGFHYRPDQPSATFGTPFGFRNNELLRAFDALRVVHYEDTTGPADWASPTRPQPIVRFAARKE
jgi:SAM-dependent methyltransferase